MDRIATTIAIVMIVGLKLFPEHPLAYAQSRSVTFGHDWVRTHPFTITALTLRPSEASDAPFDLDKYRGAGLNSMLLWKPRQNSIDVANATDFPVLMHDLRGPKFEGDSTQIGKDFIVQYDSLIPSIEGWLISDEPQIKAFGLVREVMDFARENYPDKLVYANMGGTGRNESSHYVDFFVHDIQPDVLSYDVYPFRKDETSDIFQGMAYVRYKAQLTNIPYWTFIQSWADPSPASGTARMPSESELRMQVFSHLGMGFTGIQYFTYDEAAGPAMVDRQNQRLPIYSNIQQLNTEVAHIGESLKLLKSTEVRFVFGKSIDPHTHQVVQHSLPTTLGVRAWDSSEEYDPYITHIQANYSGTVPNVLEGDLLVGHFVPALETFDGPEYENEIYFMVTNLLSDENADSQGAMQTIRIDFDFQGSDITSLQRLNRETGVVEVIPLIPTGASQYYMETTLEGGTGDLFKYNTGAPFVVAATVPEPTSDVLAFICLVSWPRGARSFIARLTGWASQSTKS